MFDKYDDGAKTLGDNKPKRYHIYMYSENKVKSHKATISNIFVYYQYKILLQQKKTGWGYSFPHSILSSQYI